MAKKEVLDFKLAPRPEQVGDKHSKQLKECEHRAGWCADSASARESEPDGIFGNDSGVGKGAVPLKDAQW
jgi:hypothetical protein